MDRKTKIDLHIHSWNSDGSYSVEQIIQKALEAGVGIISITDHDVIEAYNEDAPSKNKIQILPGVEIDALEKDVYYHVLGYGIDLNNTELIEFLKENNERLENVDRRLIDKMVIDHPQLSLEEYEEYEYDHTLGGWKLLHYLVYKGLSKDLWDSFRYFGIYNHSYACVEFPPIEFVCEIIHRAGGKTVLAHPGKVLKYTTLDDFQSELERLVDTYTIDGIECYYSTHSKEITDICVNVANKRGLLITSGSDCHGVFEEFTIGQMNIYPENLVLGDLLEKTLK